MLKKLLTKTNEKWIQNHIQKLMINTEHENNKIAYQIYVNQYISESKNCRQKPVLKSQDSLFNNNDLG